MPTDTPPFIAKDGTEWPCLCQMVTRNTSIDLAKTLMEVSNETVNRTVNVGTVCGAYTS